MQCVELISVLRKWIYACDKVLVIPIFVVFCIVSISIFVQKRILPEHAPKQVRRIILSKLARLRCIIHTYFAHFNDVSEVIAVIVTFFDIISLLKMMPRKK